MRVLTVRQPWAWAIVHAGKHVENRTTNVAGGYRGPVAIHAGLTFEHSALADPTLRSVLPPELPAAVDAFQQRRVLGAVIGVVDLVDVHLCHQLGEAFRGADCCQPWGEHEYVDIRRLCEPDATRLGVIQHLVLANPRPLPEPVPARGRLGLWTPDPDLLAQITNQLQEAS